MDSTEFTAEEFDAMMESDTLQLAIEAAGDALQVIELTPHIREYLLENDPYALTQVLDAIAQLAKFRIEK